MVFRINKSLLWLSLSLLCIGVLAACQEDAPRSGDFTITVAVDGESLVYRYDKRISVGQFLDEVGITLGEDDKINPLLQTQVRDGIRITITRVIRREECENIPRPYATERQFTHSLPPGEESIAQTGENGIEQICYRIIEEDGVQTGRYPGAPILIKAPRNEIIYVGSESPDTLVPVEGILTFISDGQAWVIEGNTVKLTPLTEEGYLDGRVFDLSPDGRQLLYTRRTADTTDPEFSNELWAVLDITSDQYQALQLPPKDVRIAQWVPGQRTYTVSYSTANPITEGAGWRAYNDLYLIQLDPESGEMLPETFQEIIPANALGLYAYWGRRFVWSPEGNYLAWANADGVGLVNLEAEPGDAVFIPKLNFREYEPLLQGAAVWIPTLSWSEDGHLITTLHGAPYADEAPEDSIIFDMGLIDVENDLQLETFIPQTGIWSNPTYSPIVVDAEGNPSYMIAYFQARDPLNSPGTEYDLWVVDRDGSNTRLIFPGLDKPGLRSPDPENGIAWSPNARQIALIHQKNLWIVEVQSGRAVQITSDGQASRPRWSRPR